jgi:uncharacterized membrane protein YfcA
MNINSDIFTEETYLRDTITLIIIFFISIVTTLSGIGGGSLLVPIFMLINDFNINIAVPLSVSTIFASTFVRIIYFYNKDHPRVAGRSLIYYFPILIIIPFITNLAFLGIILADTMPIIITAVVILLLLGYTFYKTLMNGIKKFKLENQKNNNSNLLIPNNESEINYAIIDDIFYETKIKKNSNNLVEIDGIDGIEIDINFGKNIHMNAKDNIKKNISMTVLLLIIITVGSTLTAIRSLYNPCSEINIILIVFQVVLITCLGLLICYFIRHDTQIRKDNNYLTTESDIIYSNKNIIKIIIISSITGILTTYIGIGGGPLIIPLLIHLRISPDVVIATGSMSGLFTSLISIINYAISSKLLWKYALSYMLSSSVGAYIGLILLNKLIKKNQSYIVFLVALLLLTSIVLLIINLIISNGKNAFINFKFNNIC